MPDRYAAGACLVHDLLLGRDGVVGTQLPRFNGRFDDCRYLAVEVRGGALADAAEIHPATVENSHPVLERPGSYGNVLARILLQHTATR